MSEQDLLDLLAQARDKNEKHDVTGLLLYAKENFIQVLEGEETTVDGIYQAILNDDRNTKNIVIQRRNIEERSFPQWSMGFKAVDEEILKKTLGYSEFFNKKLTQKEIVKQENEVMSLLYGFKNCTQ
jgi:hypothetical protein